jgi:hypothetical protein
MSAEILLTPTVYRRYILGKQGLWSGRRWQGKAGVAEAIRTCEAVQIDPVSVLAPSHDLVLWGRVLDYHPIYLDQLLYTDREFFDYGSCIFIYPMEELPYWRVVMAQKRQELHRQQYAEAHASLLETVRQMLRDKGPTRSRDIEGNAVEHYRSSKDAGVALFFLWIIGELMIHRRQGKERVYDFLENVAPTQHQWTATLAEAQTFFIRKGIAHSGFVSEREFRSIVKWAIPGLSETPNPKQLLKELVEAGQLAVAHLEDQKEPLYFLAEDTSLLETLCDHQLPSEWQPQEATTESEVVFLSPLEYVSARGRAKRIFGFEYIWEIYKPDSQRRYGPYTLPVLYGDTLVARMDAKVDRKNETLILNGFWLEDGFTPTAEFATAFSHGLLRLCRFLSCRHINTDAVPNIPVPPQTVGDT